MVKETNPNPALFRLKHSGTKSKQMEHWNNRYKPELSPTSRTQGHSSHVSADISHIRLRALFALPKPQTFGPSPGSEKQR